MDTEERTNEQIRTDIENSQATKQFYTVENENLVPVQTNDMKSGIFRKPNVVNSSSKSVASDQNVYLTTEPQGQIVSIDYFKRHYTVLNNIEFARKQTNSVLLLKHNEKQQQEKSTTETLNDKNSNTSSSLMQFAADLQKGEHDDLIVVDKAENMITRIAKNKPQQTVYRFLSADKLGLKPPIPQTSHKARVGRPRKRALQLDKTQSVAEQFKCSKIQAETIIAAETIVERTRSGRCIKPLAVSADNDIQTVRELVNELRDSDYRCNLSVQDKELVTKTEQKSTTQQLRRVPPEAICPTCKKIFLGRRLQKHFTQHPDHMHSIIDAKTNLQNLNGNEVLKIKNLTLFQYLVLKLQKTELSEEQRVEIFLNEINDFVAQLRCRSSRLIRNTSGLHMVSARAAHVLGIPEGQYALDMSAIEAMPETEIETAEVVIDSASRNRNGNCLEDTALSMSLDNTITDEAAQKLNLSAGGKLLPPSEESLLRNVEDLLPGGIKKLTAKIHHYEQANDNAVEAVTLKATEHVQQPIPLLDLPTDFFQFKNN